MVGLLYYYARVSASGSAAVAREITLGRFNPQVNINVNANVHTVSNQGYVTPSYVFATLFFGGQVSANLTMLYADANTSLNATATATPFFLQGATLNPLRSSKTR
jgi:hypothetical protein